MREAAFLEDVDRRVSTVTIHRWDDGCSSPVVLYEVTGGGHTLPGTGRPALAAILVGAENGDIVFAEELWR